MQDLTPLPRPAAPRRRLWTALGLSTALALAGCGVIVQNRLPAEALARQNQAPNQE